MHRILFKIGNVPIYAWGTMIAIGFFVGLLLILKETEKNDVKKDDVIDLALYILIVGILGGRVAYVIGNWKLYEKRPIHMFYIQEGGLVLFGSIIGAILVSAIFVKIKKINFWKAADVMSIGAPLGISIGRIGCFLNGCCWGKISYTFGLRFPNYYNPPVYVEQLRQGLIPQGSMHTLPVIPTELLHSLSALIVFFLIYSFYKKGKKIFDGQIFLLFAIYYSIGRFLVEFLRYYEPNKYVGPFTGSQIMSILLFIWGIYAYDRKRKNSIKSKKR